MPLVLMLTLAMAAVASALALQSIMERPIAAAHARTATLHARAEDGVARVVEALSTTAAWTMVPAVGVGVPGLSSAGVVLIGPRVVTITTLTTQLNAMLAGQWPMAAATPRWVALGGMAEGTSGFVAWVADDPGDTDGSPLADANNRLLVRVHAFGAGGGEVALQVLVGRVGGVVRVLTWREDW